MRLLLVAVIAVTAGCLEIFPVEENGPNQDESPLTLYVSNQSFAQPDARIQVDLDGRRVFDRDAPVKDQHHWQQTSLRIENGTHSIRTQETVSGTTEERTFQSNGPRWIVVDYWTDPSRLTIIVNDQPVAFD